MALWRWTQWRIGSKRAQVVSIGFFTILWHAHMLAILIPMGRQSVRSQFAFGCLMKAVFMYTANFHAHLWDTRKLGVS